MPVPSVVELRTAQAIIRQQRQKEEFKDKPNYGAIAAWKLAETNFSDQILAMVEAAQASGQSKETYLADGVYASHDGYQIWLRAERDNMTHRIAIDDGTWQALKEYVSVKPWLPQTSD